MSLSKGEIREKKENYSWQNDETINVRKSISIIEYKVERLTELDKKLILYCNKFGYKKLEQKVLTKYKTIQDMYLKMNVHDTVIQYLSEYNDYQE